MDIDSLLSTVLQNSSYDGVTEVPHFPQTNEPVWFLGRKYILPSEQEGLEDDVKMRLWFTYRKNFTSIGGMGPTSDQGWGCMLRCGQMMLAQVLVCNHINRDWRWKPELDKSDDIHLVKYNKILRLFTDERDSCYSVHQIASMGETEGKAIGEWFGPNTVAHVLRKLSAYDKWGNVSLYVCMDNAVISSEIINHCKSRDASNNNKPETVINDNTKDSEYWKPLLLVIPLRLGVSDVNPTYYNQLKACFRLEQSVGVLGGKPSHAYWFVGYTENNLLYFDPHVTQPRVDPHDEEKLHDTYHVDCPHNINIKELDPSLSLGFFCKTENEFKHLCRSFQEEVIGKSQNPILEIYPTRPSHLIDIFKSQSMRSKAEGQDQDNYEDFEIIG